MKYKFDITLTEDDYLEFNKFVLLHTPRGKKTITKTRFLIGFIYLVAIILLLLRDISPITLIGVGLLLVLLVISELTMGRRATRTFKKRINAMKKTGKLPYDPQTVVIFTNDSIVETTDSTKTERLYASIEGISIVRDKVIYIHTSQLSAYIMPKSCFSNSERYDNFVTFLKTINSNITIYQ